MQGSHRLAVERSPHPADVALLEERVAQAAVAAAGLGKEEEFAIFVRDEAGRIVAGVSALAWGGCCELEALWVEERLRGQGLARAIVSRAEDEGRRRGCRLVLLRTYDLLAVGLFEHLGYETACVIDGYPRGSATRLYRKDL